MAEEPLENMLRQTLKRVQPPVGLEQKIMAKVRTASPKIVHRQKLWLVTAACLTMALVVTGLMAYRQHLAEESKEQLIFALQITSQTLDMAFKNAFYETNERIKQISQEEAK